MEKGMEDEEKTDRQKPIYKLEVETVETVREVFKK